MEGSDTSACQILRIHLQLCCSLAAPQARSPDSPRWLMLSGAPRERVADALQRCQGKVCNTTTLEQQPDAMAQAKEDQPSGPGAS